MVCLIVTQNLMTPEVNVLTAVTMSCVCVRVDTIIILTELK